MRAGFETEPEVLERVDGIEPTIPLWKRGVLPLNYTRAGKLVSLVQADGQASVTLRNASGVFTDCERK